MQGDNLIELAAVIVASLAIGALLVYALTRGSDERAQMGIKDGCGDGLSEATTPTPGAHERMLEVTGGWYCPDQSEADRTAAG